MNEKSIKWLKKSIKQIKAVICSFQYQYFSPMNGEITQEFEDFRNDTLFKLVDQWKKMEAELAKRRGRI